MQDMVSRWGAWRNALVPTTCPARVCTPARPFANFRGFPWCSSRPPRPSRLPASLRPRSAARPGFSTRCPPSPRTCPPGTTMAPPPARCAVGGESSRLPAAARCRLPPPPAAARACSTLTPFPSWPFAGPWPRLRGVHRAPPHLQGPLPRRRQHHRHVRLLRAPQGAARRNHLRPQAHPHQHPRRMRRGGCAAHMHTQRWPPLQPACTQNHDCPCLLGLFHRPRLLLPRRPWLTLPAPACLLFRR